jgi:hypothetical protein
MSNRGSHVATGLSILSSAIALTLYLRSLFLPAFECGDSFESETGLEVLLDGWTGLFVFEFRWLANLLFPILVLHPFFVLRLPAGRIRLVTLLLPLVASCLALASLLWRAPGCGMSGGTAVYSKAIGAGGELWVAAIFLASATFVLRVLLSRGRANKPLQPIARKDARSG